MSIIIGFGKDRLPIISPLRDMMRVTDCYGSGYPWHDYDYTQVKYRVSIKNRYLSLFINGCPYFTDEV